MYSSSLRNSAQTQVCELILSEVLEKCSSRVQVGTYAPSDPEVSLEGLVQINRVWTLDTSEVDPSFEVQLNNIQSAINFGSTYLLRENQTFK